MKKEDFLKLMDGIDDRLVEKYAISDKAKKLQYILVMEVILKIMRIMEMRKKSFCYRHTFLILEWRSRTFRKSKR